MLKVTQQGDDVLVDVKVVPKASRDRIVGELDGALKIAVAAAPEKGAANEAVCRLLAKSLGLRAQQVRVETGQTNPRKTIRILGIAAQEVSKLVES